MSRESPSQRARATGTAGWRTTVGLLGADRFFQISLAVYGLVLVSIVYAPASAEGLPGVLLNLAQPVLLVLTLAAMLWNQGRTEGPERRFWGLLALAWACLLAGEFLSFTRAPVPFVSVPVVLGSVYILYYLIYALAVDLSPHFKSDRSLTVTRRRLESVAGLAAIFGLIFYFGIVAEKGGGGFSLNFAPAEKGYLTLLLVRISLDLLILGRLIQAAATARAPWSRLYLLLATGMFFYGLKDVLFVLRLERVIPDASSGFWHTAFLSLPGLLALIAARYRQLPFADTSMAGVVSDPEETEEVARSSPIALYALLVPAVHFLLSQLGVMAEVHRPPREVFSLIYILVLGALAWIHQRVIVKDTRRYRRALREAEGQLFRSRRLEAVGRLAGGIAHDFNNYLTVISGYGEILRENLDDEQSQTDIGYIEEAAEKATNLTRQLLAFGRRQVLKPEPLDLNKVVRETSKLLRSLLGEDVHVDLELDPATGLARADLGQTEQVVMNLAINGRDAMPGGGTLSIRTRRTVLSGARAADLDLAPGSYVALVVSDTGRGMSEEVKAQIFEPFFTTKELGRGTGLGLSTVHGIVSQSGGAVSVESAPGEGTTVEVFLPTAQAAPEPDKTLLLETDSRPMSATVLLVEDEEPVRRLAARTLTENGFRVSQAASGEAALAQLPGLADSLDLLITDVVMPGQDGTALAVALLDRYPGLRVLFVSGYPTVTLRERQAVLPPSIRFLQKPFTPSDLLEAVRRVLDEPVHTGQTGVHLALSLNVEVDRSDPSG